MINTVLTVLKIWAAVLTRPHSKALKTSSAAEEVFPTCSKAYSAEAALEDSADSVHRAAVRHEAAAAPRGAQTSGMTCRSILPTLYTARRLKYSIHATSIVRSAKAREASAGAAERCAPTVRVPDRYGRIPAFSPLRVRVGAAADRELLSKIRAKNQKIIITIPAGVEEGKRITIPKQGNAGSGGGDYGDLYVFIFIKPHHLFERHGNDLYCVIPISMTQAALGGEISVKSLNDKRLTVKIPAGTQHGDALKVRGEGVPAASGRTGDLYLKVIIKIPTRISSGGKKLLSEFSAMEGENTAPEMIPLSKL